MVGVAAAARMENLTIAAPARAASRSVALAALPAALDGMLPGALRKHLSACWESLPWVSDKLAEAAGIDDTFAFVELVGPDACARVDGLRFGFYLQLPGVLYPAHIHAAEEFYYVLSGDCEWRHNAGEFALQPPASLIHHQPWDLHAMRTRNLPLLAMWIWSGDVDYSTYRFLNGD